MRIRLKKATYQDKSSKFRTRLRGSNSGLYVVRPLRDSQILNQYLLNFKQKCEIFILKHFSFQKHSYPSNYLNEKLQFDMKGKRTRIWLLI